MLNRKSIERALARAAGHQDESVVARLALFAPALLKAADLRAQLAAEAPEWTDEEIEAARLGNGVSPCRRGARGRGRPS